VNTKSFVLLAVHVHEREDVRQRMCCKAGNQKRE
jgi:hypothetical protein